MRLIVVLCCAAGVGFTHFTGEVKKMLSKILSIDQDNYPEMLGHTCIINAGGIVSILFRFIKPYLDIRTQNKIEARAGVGSGSDSGSEVGLGISAGSAGVLGGGRHLRRPCVVCARVGCKHRLR